MQVRSAPLRLVAAALGIAAITAMVWWAGDSGGPGEDAARVTGRSAEGDAPGARLGQIEAGAADEQRAPVARAGAGDHSAQQRDPRIGDGPFRVLEGRTLERRPDGTLQPYPDCPLEIGPISPPMQATSDDGGRFRIELSGGDFRMASVMLSTAVSPGAELIDWARRIDFDEGQRTVSGVTVVLAPSPEFTGTVMDPSGAPMADVEVGVRGQPPTRTDDAGLFNLGHLPGDLYGDPRDLESRLFIQATDGLLLSASVPGFDGEGVWGLARIVAARPVLLTVEDQVTGETGTEQRASAVGVRSDHPLASAGHLHNVFVVGPVGDSIALAPAGIALEVTRGRTRYTLVDSAGQLREDHFDGAASPIVLTADTTLGIAPVPTIRLTGTVFEGDGGRAVNAALEVFALGGGLPRLGLPQLMGETNGFGEFNVEIAIPESATQVLVRATSRVGMGEAGGFFFAPRYADPLQRAEKIVPLTDRPGTVRRLTLRLETYPSIQGRVLGSGGAPVGGAQLWLEPGPGMGPVGSDWTVSNTDGTFEFGHLAPGSYRLLASSVGHGMAELDSVSPGGPALEVRFEPDSLAEITVTVEAPGPLGTLKIGGATLFHGSDDRVPPLGSTYGPHGGGVHPWTGTFTSEDGQWRGAMSMEALPLDTGEPRATHVLSLPAGVGWIVAKGRTEEGVELTLVGTGPVRLRSGQKSAVTLRLAPSATAHFSLPGSPGRVLRIVDPRTNRVVPVTHTNGKQRNESLLGAAGELALAGLPVIPLEAWVGSRESVRDGTPEERVPFRPRPGEVVEVER